MRWICNEHRGGGKQRSVRGAFVVWWHFYKLVWARNEWTLRQLRDEKSKEGIWKKKNCSIYSYNDPTTVTDICRTREHTFLQLLSFLSATDTISIHPLCLFMRRPLCLWITSVGAATKYQYERHRQHNAGLHQIRTTASAGTRTGTLMNTCGQRWMPRIQGAGSSFRITGHVTDSVC